MNTCPRIVIIGGGFAGVKCARTLRRKLSREQCEIVIFNRENHMVFHPLLAEVAGASINPAAVSAPLRQMLRDVNCRTETVCEISLEQGEIGYEGHDGQVRRLKYDHVIVACGAAVNLGMIPGMADHAFPLKTVGDAVALRAHVMQQLEKAEVCDNPVRKGWYLSFVVVGGGFSGVEAAGEINDLVRESMRFFQNVVASDVTVTIIHSRDQLLPEISPTLREFARLKMEKAGIKVALNARVAFATPDGVGLDDGRMISGATLVCTIGNSVPMVVTRLEATKEAGRLVAEADMRLRGHDNVWAVGDCARIINSFDNKACPPTGQFAERQGKQVAQNIIRVLHGQPTQSFYFKPLGQLCAIGGRSAVAEFLGVRMSGFSAWFFWRSVYLFKLPSWSRKFKAGFDWAWELFFARDLAHLKTDQTQRVVGAHYASGDYIFRQGDPGANFYVIEKGEVEVLHRAGAEKPDNVLNVLGPGDFFGEMALVDNVPRSASIRARTQVEVVVIGRHVFSQISGSLKPLHTILARSMKRRSINGWQRWPAARNVLEHAPITSFIEPLPTPALKIDSTIQQAIRLFSESRTGFCCVVDEQQSLLGILTRTDIFGASERGAHSRTIVGEMMVAPISITKNDSSLVAATIFRDHGLKFLPVIDSQERRHLVGYVRAETMLMHVLQNLPVE